MLLEQFDPSTVTKIEFIGAGRHTILEKENDQWLVTHPFRAPSNNTSINQHLITLQFLERGLTVDASAESLDKIGLSEPAKESKCTRIKLWKNDKVTTIDIGTTSLPNDKNLVKFAGSSVAGRRYVRNHDSNTISLVNYSFSEFQSNPHEWYNKHLPSFPARVKSVNVIKTDGSTRSASREKPQASFTHQGGNVEFASQKALSTILSDGNIIALVTKNAAEEIPAQHDKIILTDFDDNVFELKVGKTWEPKDLKTENADEIKGSMEIVDQADEEAPTLIAVTITAFENAAAHTEKKEQFMIHAYLHEQDLRDILKL